MLWGFPPELEQTFKPIQDLLKGITIRRSEPPSAGAFAQLCEVITEARHVARILLRGGGGTPNPSTSDQSRPHMSIYKLLSFLLFFFNSKQDKMKTAVFLL